MTFKEAIGKKILERRLELNMSQKELADKSGVGQAQISKIENGENLPSISSLNDIRVILSVDFNYFFEDICGLNSPLSKDKHSLLFIYDHLNTKNKVLLSKIAKIIADES